jgi:hypothetical protein
VEILVNAGVPVQAFEVALRWDPEMLQATSVAPHPDFDDDGALFTTPRIDLAAGTVDRIADLRHGEPGAEGIFKIATVYFTTLSETGSTSIELTEAGLARSDGSEPPLNFLSLPITILP